MLEDLEDDEANDQLVEVTARLRANRLDLCRTIYALRTKRRTPAQLQDLYKRCEGVRRRSQLIRQRHAGLRTVH